MAETLKIEAVVAGTDVDGRPIAVATLKFNSDPIEEGFRLWENAWQKYQVERALHALPKKNACRYENEGWCIWCGGAHPLGSKCTCNE